MADMKASDIAFIVCAFVITVCAPMGRRRAMASAVHQKRDAKNGLRHSAGMDLVGRRLRPRDAVAAGSGQFTRWQG